MKIVRVNIHKGLTPVSIEEEYKLNVSVVNYVLFESKIKSGQSRIKSRHLLRVLWKLDHLGPIWMNGSTNNFISSRCCNRWYKVNKAPEWFLYIVQVLLSFRKTVNQYIVLANILQINMEHISCIRYYYWLSLLEPAIILWLAHPECILAVLLVCYYFNKQ